MLDPGLISMARGNFGERLKREREMREVSLTEITSATRIGPRFLEALENEDWDKLPGGAFNRGFVRSVARYLGLDEESLLAEYDLARNEHSLHNPHSHAPAPLPAESRFPPKPKWPAAVAVLVLILLVAGLVAAGFYGWRIYSAHRLKKQSLVQSLPAGVQPVAATPAPSAPEPPPIVSAPRPLDLSLSTSAATRVRILADGKLLLDAELRAGETRHFSAARQFQVTAADSSAVLLELNGQAMPPLGAPGASGTIVLSQRDLRQAPGGNSQP